MDAELIENILSYGVNVRWILLSFGMTITRS